MASSLPSLSSSLPPSSESDGYAPYMSMYIMAYSPRSLLLVRLTRLARWKSTYLISEGLAAEEDATAAGRGFFSCPAVAPFSLAAASSGSL